MAITCRLIIRCVAERFGSSETELKSARRPRHITRQRQAYYWLARELTGKSLPVIGRELGDRDHSTVHQQMREIERIMAQDVSVRALMQELKVLVIAAEATLARLGLSIPNDIDPVEVADRMMSAPFSRMQISADELQALGTAVLGMNDLIQTMEAELAALKALPASNQTQTGKEPHHEHGSHT